MTGGYWWCAECHQEVDCHCVTDQEMHDTCRNPVVWVEPKDPITLLRTQLAALQAENAELRAQLGANSPLTLEELRGMDGEPVWVRRTNGNDRCRICAGVYDNPQTGDAEVLFDGQPDIMVWDGGKTWLAYRRKPNGGGE